MNTLLEYSSKTQINLIFALTSLHNFIKDHLLQDINYFKADIDNFIILSNKFDNLLLSSSLVISI